MTKRPFSAGSKDRQALLWLSLLSAVTHFRWLFDPRIFTSGDWWYIGLQRYHDFAHFSPIWVTDGFGSTSATPHFYFIRFLEGVLTSVGSSFALNEKIFFFVPITFGASLGAYLLAREYFNEKLSFVGAIVFAFNTAALFNHAGPLTIGVACSLAPWALYSFKKFLEAPGRTVILIATALIFGVMAIYELRLSLVIGALAMGMFVFNTSFVYGWSYAKERFVALIKLSLLILALHAFWILPYIVSSRAVTFSDVLGRGLFVSFSDIQNALTLHHPFWTGLRPATFIVQSIPLYAWIIPLAAFAGFLFRLRQVNKEMCYWALVALAGIFLVKQVNEPFTNAYPWLFGHIPGFGAFRESSKFYVVVALAYAILIPFTLSVLETALQNRSLRLASIRLPSRSIVRLAIGTIVGLFLINALPLLSGDFRTLYTPRKMPQDYAILEKFINSQPDYFRTLWMPVNSRWSVQSNLHPNIQATNISQGAWLSQLGDTQRIPLATLRDKTSQLLNQLTSDSMLDRASIKYVIVPLRDTDNEDDFFRYYGDDRNYYIQRLNSLGYLKRINIGAKNLVIYENQDYQPYIAGFTNLQTLAVSKNTDIDPLYDVVNKQLHTDLNFIVPQSGRPAYPSTLIEDVFQDIRAKDIGEVTLAKTVGPFEHPQLYIKTDHQQLRYVLQKGVISFYAQQPDMQVKGNTLEAKGQPEKLLATKALDKKMVYYLVTDEETALLPIEDDQRDLGVLNKPLELYASNAVNVLPNSSFESGLWQPKVRDCNNYDGHPAINMALTEDMSTDGKKSLELQADRHTACTESPFIRKESNAYLLTFDYSVIGGRSAGFEIVFNDPKHTTLKEDLHLNSDAWQKYQKAIHIPVNASGFTIRLLGYPDYRLESTALTYYDNLHLTPLGSVLNVFPPPSASPKPIPLPSKTPLQVTYQNKVNQSDTDPIKNGSFETGLWQKKVADCDAYDARPDIQMELTTRTGANNKALELAARRHTACTSQQNIKVSGGSQYLLSFDYQSPNAHNASYFLQFNDTNRTTIEENIPIKDKQWHTYTRQIRAPLEATNLHLVVYAHDQEASKQKIINRYDNFSLRKIPTILSHSYFIADSPSVILGRPGEVSFKSVRPTKKLIRVTSSSAPFYLSMSETYNPLWRLEINNDKTRHLKGILPNSSVDMIPESQHFRLNDFQNGWYVDPTALCRSGPPGCTRNANGSYTIELVAEFTPQRWFYVGTLISLFALGGCGTYLVYRLYRKQPLAQKGSRR